MKKTIFLIVIIIILIGGIFVVFAKFKKKSESNVSAASRQNTVDSSVNIGSSSNVYQSQTDDQAEVTVDVTPKILGAGRETNIFNVALNTHSVELDYDFVEIMILKDDLGNIYRALEWTGGRGGHHMSGDIIFPKLTPGVQSLELQIFGIGGVDRVFKWNI